MFNRSALILKFKVPAIDWLNTVNASMDIPDELRTTHTLESVNCDRNVYLVHFTLGEDPKKLDKWLKQNAKVLFERELDDWFTDPTLWPKKRNYKLFTEWFEPECHECIEDTLFDEPLYIEEEEIFS